MNKPSAINTTARMKNRNFADKRHIHTNASEPARHITGRFLSRLWRRLLISHTPLINITL